MKVVHDTVEPALLHSLTLAFVFCFPMAGSGVLNSHLLFLFTDERRRRCLLHLPRHGTHWKASCRVDNVQELCGHGSTVLKYKYEMPTFENFKGGDMRIAVVVSSSVSSTPAVDSSKKKHLSLCITPALANSRQAASAEQLDRSKNALQIHIGRRVAELIMCKIRKRTRFMTMSLKGGCNELLVLKPNAIYHACFRLLIESYFKQIST